MKKYFAKTFMSLCALGISSVAFAQEAAETAVEGGMYQALKTKFIEGGADFMSLVAIALIFGLAFCLERIIYLNLAETNSSKLLKGIEEALDKGDVEDLDRWEIVDKLSGLLLNTNDAEEILNVTDTDGTLYPACGGVVVNNGQMILVLDVDEYGFVCAITLLSSECFSTNNDQELHLIKILAGALCEGKIQQLQDVLAFNCIYRSDYSGKKEFGIISIIEKISSVNNNLDDTTQYNFEIVPAREELLKAEMEDLPGIYRGKWCLRLYQGQEKKLAAIVFIRINDNGEITNIYLRC